MNEIMRKQPSGIAALPIDQVDTLDAEVESLYELVRWEKDEDLALPSSAKQTAAQARAALQPASRNAILDAFAMLAGIFGQRGDAQVWATFGAQLVEAERPGKIALMSALLAMVRPAPAEAASAFNDWQDKPATGRKFGPQFPEFLAEIIEQQGRWVRRLDCIEKKLEGHDDGR